MIELIDIALNAEPVVQEARDPAYAEELKMAAVAIAVGLATIGAGYAERGIGAAAVGAMAEDEEMFGKGLIMTVLPETLVIFAIVIIFLV